MSLASVSTNPKTKTKTKMPNAQRDAKAENPPDDEEHGVIYVDGNEDAESILVCRLNGLTYLIDPKSKRIYDYYVFRNTGEAVGCGTTEHKNATIKFIH